MTASAPFDQFAPRYDEIWTHSPAGRRQRDAVWRHIEPLFRAGDHVLDLGCGTGEDARHLEASGIRVRAFDASPGMVGVARYRGVDASILRLEELDRIDPDRGPFDGALSNFGALNCLENIGMLRAPLAQLIRPGGYLALCVMGRFCLWETLWYTMRGQIRKAGRRWSGSAHSASLDLDVFYPTAGKIARLLAPDFTLAKQAGIGVCVPPPFVNGLSEAVLMRCDAADRRIAAWPIARSLADHRLLIFARN